MSRSSDSEPNAVKSNEKQQQQQQQQDIVSSLSSSSPPSNFNYPIQQARYKLDLEDQQEEEEEEASELEEGIGNINAGSNVDTMVVSESDKENAIHDNDNDNDNGGEDNDIRGNQVEVQGDNSDCNVNHKLVGVSAAASATTSTTASATHGAAPQALEAKLDAEAETEAPISITQELLAKSIIEPVQQEEQEQDREREQKQVHTQVPFSHPSSPISQQNNSLLSLQKDFDFDQSLTLDDHDASLLNLNNNSTNNDNNYSRSNPARKKGNKHKLDNYISQDSNYIYKKSYHNDGGDDQDQVESTFDSSYVSFPPSSSSSNNHNNNNSRRRTRSGSIVSAATSAASFATSAYSISTALSSQRSERGGGGGGGGGNGTKKERRRRPRPWDDAIVIQKNTNSSNNPNELIMNQSNSTVNSIDDNHNNNNNSKDNNNGKNDVGNANANANDHYNYDDVPKGERTPLLLTNTTSMHSAKTCKRNNTNINMLMKSTATTTGHHDHQQQFKNHCNPSSSSLSFESNDHLHTEAQYGSINNTATVISAANTVVSSSVAAATPTNNKHNNNDNNPTSNTNDTGTNAHKTNNNEHELNMDYQYTPFFNNHISNNNYTTPSSYYDDVDDDNVKYPSIFHQYYHQLRRYIDNGHNNNYHHHDRPIITTIITYLTMSHFMLMALYNTFIHYKLHRLGQSEKDITTNVATGGTSTPPYWISYIGRVYNPAIGPNAQTLILFGVFHPVLIIGDVLFDHDNDIEDYKDYKDYNENGNSSSNSNINQNYDTSGEWWRFGVSAICCTSMVQIICNVFILTFLNGRERDIGSWNVLLTFSLSVLCGGFFSIVSTYGFGSGSWFGFNSGYSYSDDDVIEITGLNCAGIMGVLTLLLTKMILFGRDHNCYDDQHYDDLLLTATIENHYEERYGYKNNNASKSTTNMRMRKKARKLTFGQRLKVLFSSFSFPQMAFGLELLNGLLLPYTSLTSIVGGAVMGVCCGLFLYSSGMSLGGGSNSIGSTGEGGSWSTNRHWNDNDSQSSSLASDLEEAFSPDMSTPPRKSIFGAPPPAPFSSSSKGLDTPIMRRSIFKSPDEDEDEIDTIRNLNKPGFTGEGLKQRNISKREERRSNHTVSSNNIMYSSKQMGRLRRIQQWGNKRRWLQFLGMLFGIFSLTLPVLYIGYFSEPINGQAVLDSMYGCKTIYGFYQYAQTDDAADEKGNNAEMDDNVKAAEQMKGAISGDVVCTEICVPLSLVSSAMNNNGEMNLQSGTCFQQEYECLVTNDSISIAGKFDMDGDIYAEGSCATGTTSTTSEQ